MNSKGISHRDLSRLNIVLDLYLRAIITDFGFSNVKTRNKIIIGATNNANGFQNWKAQETYDESNLYTEKADIYYLGIVIWELVTCEYPFKRNSGFVHSELSTWVFNNKITDSIMNQI